MPRKKHEYHYIYKTTNILNNRYYIGMHSTSNLEDGYLGSGRRIRDSINKYGKDNHIKEILEFLPNRKFLTLREEEIVNNELLIDPLCMNLRIGGDPGATEWTIEQRILGGKNGGFNTAKSEKENPVIAKNQWNNRSLIMKECHRLGKIKYDTFTGKKHNEESKKLIGTKNSNKQKGIKNSQYGTIWINKDGIDKKVKKEYFSNYLEEGWVKGRNKKVL